MGAAGGKGGTVDDFRQELDELTSQTLEELKRADIGSEVVLFIAHDTVGSAPSLLWVGSRSDDPTQVGKQAARLGLFKQEPSYTFVDLRSLRQVDDYRWLCIDPGPMVLQAN